MQTHDNDKLKADTKKLHADVHRLAVDIRGRIHTAKKEVAGEWTRLEPFVTDAGKKFGSATEASKLGLEELLKSVQHVRDSLT